MPGMGGVNSYFFMHNWIEDTDALMSKVNILEAGKWFWSSFCPLRIFLELRQERLVLLRKAYPTAEMLTLNITTDMILQFFVYLVHNGLKTEDITVLTFYNGQRKLILSRLRRNKELQ